MQSFLKSIKYALKGVQYVFKHEQNFRLQIVATVFVVTLMLYAGLSRNEMIILILLITAVLTLEMLNSALEAFADVIKPRLSDHIRRVKDILAGMVLLVALVSAIVGLMIFWPYIVELT